MRIFFLGKRHYTNRDVLVDRFGRIYWFPQVWQRSGHAIRLLLLDYHSMGPREVIQEGLAMQSLPAFGPRTLKKVSASVASFRPDIVFATGDCFAGLLGYRLARRHNAKFVFDVYDDYTAFGAYRAFLGWNAMGFLRRRADLVVYASRAMQDQHGFTSPSTIALNGIDPETFSPGSREQARERLGLTSAGPLVGYFGSMSAEHGVSVLIRAVGILRHSRPDLQLLLCGKADPQTPLDGEGIIFRGLVPHSAIPDYLNACDVLALPYQRGQFIDNASSCKIAEYLACRRPIVATDTPNFVRNFPEQAGELESLLAPPGDAEALARSLERQLTAPVIAQPCEQMSWRRIAGSLASTMQELGV